MNDSNDITYSIVIIVSIVSIVIIVCAPEITRVKFHSKRPLKVHWTLPVIIHWRSVNPLEHTTDKWNSIWKCHWKSTMISEVTISGVQSFAPIRVPFPLLPRTRPVSRHGISIALVLDASKIASARALLGDVPQLWRVLRHWCAIILTILQIRILVHVYIYIYN